jgi:hypothetical protein
MEGAASEEEKGETTVHFQKLGMEFTACYLVFPEMFVEAFNPAPDATADYVCDKKQFELMKLLLDTCKDLIYLQNETPICLEWSDTDSQKNTNNAKEFYTRMKKGEFKTSPPHTIYFVILIMNFSEHAGESAEQPTQPPANQAYVGSSSFCRRIQRVLRPR